MRRGSAAAVPKEVEDLQQRLEHWRSTHKRRGRLPEVLWVEAATLARQHGVYQTARTLRLEYTRLWYWSKSLHQPAGRALDNAAPPEFVELIAPPTVGLCECVIEWESAHGKVTIHVKGTTMPDLSGLRCVVEPAVIQITPQMRILVAVEAIDGRKGMDALAQLCREKLKEDPFSGCLFVFRTRNGAAIKILAYDGQGFWIAQKRLSKGRFRWWPSGSGAARTLEAYQVQLLLAAGNPDTEAAPVWRRIA